MSCGHRQRSRYLQVGVGGTGSPGLQVSRRSHPRGMSQECIMDYEFRGP